jgi:hypothetical protein
MNGSKGLPTQGYVGMLVAHKDQETSLKDWQREIGGTDYDKLWKEACSQKADSVWCAHLKEKMEAHSHSSSSTHYLAIWLLILGLGGFMPT